MKANGRRRAMSHVPRSPEQAPAEPPPEFLAACFELVKRPTRSSTLGETSRAGDARGEDNPELREPPRPTVEPERLDPSTSRPTGADRDMHHHVIRGLEAQIEDLRDALATSNTRDEEISSIRRENKALRDALARTREQRTADARDLESFLSRQESAAQDEIETLRRALETVTADRDAHVSELTEARRHEVQIRTELDALRKEVDLVSQRHQDSAMALEAVTQLGAQARADLAAAMADHESKVEMLHGAIADRDQQIDELRRLLVESEEARAAEAAAFLDILTSHGLT